MSWTEYFIIFGCCFATILACRVVPMFVLKGKELSASTRNALGMIPAAAFAALVTNDLFKPQQFDLGAWQNLMPLIAAAVVVLVAVKTKNLVWCVVAGVGTMALLMFVQF